LQVICGYRVLNGSQIQKNLKKHDLSVSNISMAIIQNMQFFDPPRMMKKKRRAKQRNRYTITEAGITYVENQLLKIDD
jgi:hypothetical protein